MPKVTSNNFKLVTAYTIWWLLWVVIQTLILHNLKYEWAVAFADAAITQISLACSGYIINTTLRYYQPRQVFKYVLTWSITMAVLSAYAQRWILQNTLSHHPDYIILLNQSLLIREAFDWLMISFITLISWLWFYVLEQQAAEKRRESAERMVREAELSNLRMQLQPHFLFNSLNSISALIGSQPEQARTMIHQLSDFLRGTVRKDDRQLVTLDEELQHLQLYLDIEKIRFGHRLATDIQCDAESRQLKLPSLLLQPLVENSIKFGLYDTVGETAITIKSHVESSQLVIEIKNPFDPETSQSKPGTGFGLNSVYRRLYLLYSQNDLLVTSQDGSVFTTLIKIPQTL